MNRNLRKSISNNSDIISASEIGQYQYCSVSWKLQRNGYIPDSTYLENGIRKHVSQGKIIGKINKITNRTKILEVIGYLLLLIAILFFIFEVIM